MTIHPDLLHLAVPIGQLTPDPKNRRVHDDRNIAAIVTSLRDHGQRKPVVCQRKDGALIIRAGNGTVEAAKRLGWPEVAALVVDESDKEAVKYALRDNRTAELAEWDLPGLGEDLRFLKEEGVLIDEVGWDAYESEPLMAAEWEPADPTNEEFVVPEKRVGLMFTKAEYDRLKALLGAKPTAAEVIRLVAVAVGRAS